MRTNVDIYTRLLLIQRIITMALLGFLGKFLIVSALLFQAFLLYQDKSESDQFQKNLKNAIASCQHCQQLRPYLEQYLRLAVVGLLATSAFMIVMKCSLFKITTLAGLFTLLWVEHHSVFCTIPTIDILNRSCLWHSLGVIGAVLYLWAAECTSCAKPAKAAVSTEERPTDRAAAKGGKKGKRD
jgi:hypothetical protein